MRPNVARGPGATAWAEGCAGAKLGGEPGGRGVENEHERSYINPSEIASMALPMPMYMYAVERE